MQIHTRGCCGKKGIWKVEVDRLPVPDVYWGTRVVVERPIYNEASDTQTVFFSLISGAVINC